MFKGSEWVSALALLGHAPETVPLERATLVALFESDNGLQEAPPALSVERPSPVPPPPTPPPPPPPPSPPTPIVPNVEARVETEYEEEPDT